MTLLDKFFPHYQFDMVHSMRVHAPIVRVYQAFKEFGPAEISPLVQILANIRELPARLTGKSHPKEADNRPWIDQMMNGDFFVLAEEPPTEFVFGFIGKFWKLSEEVFIRLKDTQEFITFSDPEYAKSAVNFLLTEEPNGWVRMTTETRIDAPGPAARLKFTLYWSIVSIGAGLIRMCWLQAVKRRAERAMVNVAGA
jgi:hypothetical protein